jgi:hypothetical protein
MNKTPQAIRLPSSLNKAGKLLDLLDWNQFFKNSPVVSALSAIKEVIAHAEGRSPSVVVGATSYPSGLAVENAQAIVIHQEADIFRYDAGDKNRPTVFRFANCQIAFKPQTQAFDDGFRDLFIANRYDLGFHGFTSTIR